MSISAAESATSIECVHMTSCPPYWRSKLILWELNSFFNANTIFFSINKYDSLSYVRTHTIILLKAKLLAIMATV